MQHRIDNSRIKTSFPATSIFVREAVVIFATVILTVVVFALINFGVARGIIRDEVRDRLQLATNNQAQLTELYVAHQLERISLVSSRTQLRRLCAQRHRGEMEAEEFQRRSRLILDDARLSTQDFVNISIADANGAIITSTDVSQLGTDLSRAEEFMIGRSKNHLGEPRPISNRFQALLTGPALSQDDELVGVVVITLDLSPLSTLLSDAGSMGSTSRIYVARAAGQSVHFLFPFDEATTEMSIEKAHPLVRAISGESGFESTQFGDHEVLAAYRPVDYQPDHRTWGMIAFVEEREAFAPIRQLVQTLLPVGLFAIVTAVGAGWWIAHRYARPIMQLAKSATKISQGHLDTRVNIRSNDEVGALGHAFNQMADRIQSSHEVLERRVDERTRDLAHVNQELKRSNRDLQQFASIASHDLQEPLRAVAGFTQLLKQSYGDQLDDEANQYMDFAVDGARRMKRLIDNLLKYARVQTDARPFEVFDAFPALETALQNLHESIEESDAKITWDDLGEIRADRAQVIQLFQNLISNAIKFRSERPLEIHIGADRTGDDIRFSVRDNGIGLRPQDQDRIFEIFERLHTQDEYAGTGLGLAICKRIVQRHGGEIWVESNPDTGSTFVFTLNQTVEASIPV